jgi:hypothetical protein
MTSQPSPTRVSGSAQGRRPWRYDLRHAVVSSWLTAGVALMRIAKWAEHSVEVPLTVHAICLDGRKASQGAGTNRRTRSRSSCSSCWMVDASFGRAGRRGDRDLRRRRGCLARRTFAHRQGRLWRSSRRCPVAHRARWWSQQGRDGLERPTVGWFGVSLRLHATYYGLARARLRRRAWLFGFGMLGGGGHKPDEHLDGARDESERFGLSPDPWPRPR